MTTTTTAKPRAKTPMKSKDANQSSPWKDRVDGGDWDRITGEVNEYGCALTPQLLTPEETGRIAALYDQDKYFRPRPITAPRAGSCPRWPATGWPHARRPPGPAGTAARSPDATGQPPPRPARSR